MLYKLSLATFHILKGVSRSTFRRWLTDVWDCAGHCFSNSWTKRTTYCIIYCRLSMIFSWLAICDMRRLSRFCALVQVDLRTPTYYSDWVNFSRFHRFYSFIVLYFYILVFIGLSFVCFSWLRVCLYVIQGIQGCLYTNKSLSLSLSTSTLHKAYLKN